MADEPETTGKLKSMPKELMPRERLLKYGPQSLRDEEVVAILLKTGVHGCNVLELSRRFCASLERGLPQLSGRLAVTMAAEDGSVYEPPVGEGPYGEDEYTHLKATHVSLKYLNRTHIRTLRAAQELGRRIYLPDDGVRHVPILRASQAAETFRERIGDASWEASWWVLFVDGRRVPIGKVQRLVQVPDLRDGRVPTFGELREFTQSLFRWAVILSARGLFVAHCNSQGGTAYTAQEVKLTEAVIEAGHAVGIAVHDHLIVDRPPATPGYVSFRAGEVCRF